VSKIKKKVLTAEVLSNKHVAADHYLLQLKQEWLGKHSCPGQFVNVKVEEDTTAPLLRIPLGIHKIEKEGISLLYKVVGDGTKKLSEKNKGAEIGILGPLGTGFDLSPLGKKGAEAVLISGGHGIAPLFVLAEEILKKKRKVKFLIGTRTKEHVLCAAELWEMGAEVYVATEDGTLGKKGYVTCLLGEHLKGDMKNTTVYSCGPKPMLAAVSEVAEMYDVPAQVSLDEYMACGIGACLGCAIKTKSGYKLVCTDGPVFDSKELIWEKTPVC